MSTYTAAVAGQPTITLDAPDAPRELFLDLFPVYENGTLLGAFTTHDLAKSYARNRAAVLAGMTR